MHTQSQSPNQGAAPSAAPAATTQQHATQRLWPAWALLGFLVFASTQLTVLAFALQGKWFVLIGPAIVCAFKAWGVWQWIRPRLGHDDQVPV